MCKGSVTPVDRHYQNTAWPFDRSPRKCCLYCLYWPWSQIWTWRLYGSDPPPPFCVQLCSIHVICSPSVLQIAILLAKLYGRHGVPISLGGPYTASVLRSHGVLISLGGMGTLILKTLVIWGWGTPYRGGPHIAPTPAPWSELWSIIASPQILKVPSSAYLLVEEIKTSL